MTHPPAAINMQTTHHPHPYRPHHSRPQGPPWQMTSSVAAESTHLSTSANKPPIPPTTHSPSHPSRQGHPRVVPLLQHDRRGSCPSPVQEAPTLGPTRPPPPSCSLIPTIIMQIQRGNPADWPPRHPLPPLPPTRDTPGITTGADGLQSILPRAR